MSGFFIYLKMISRFSLLIIVFFLSFVIHSNAQQTGILRGKVTDAASKETLPGASFVLLSNTTRGTTTDIDGNYGARYRLSSVVLCVCGIYE